MPIHKMQVILPDYHFTICEYCEQRIEARAPFTRIRYERIAGSTFKVDNLLFDYHNEHWLDDNSKIKVD